jgi:MFS family permease
MFSMLTSRIAIVTNAVALVAIPAWAALADRIGRKPVFIFGALGSGGLMFAYLAAIASGHYALIFLAAILMSGVVYSAQNGVWPALYGEMFPTKVRLSGMAIGTQIGFAIGGFAPTVAAAIAEAARAGGCRWRPTCSPSASSPPSPSPPRARRPMSRWPSSTSTRRSPPLARSRRSGDRPARA